jgi:hypothetical protein
MLVQMMTGIINHWQVNDIIEPVCLLEGFVSLKKVLFIFVYLSSEENADIFESNK